MANKSEQHNKRGGGALIAIFTLGGAITGIALGQPSIGFIAGVGFGAGLATLLWLRDRKHDSD